MNNKDKLLENLNSQNIFKDLYEMGYTQSDIKKHIKEVLSPYFRNAKNLEKYAINFLVPDFINLIKVKEKYGSVDEEIISIIDTYYEAREVNSIKLFDILKSLIPDVIESGNKFWSFLNLEKDKSELEIYEFVKVTLDDISNIIEGLMKYYIVEHIVVNRIIRNKYFEINKLKNTKLGVLLDELINNSPYPSLFKTIPDDLKFTDWRNISAHQDYRLDSQNIILSYGVGITKNTITLTRDELFDRVKQIMRTMEILNLSHKFFGFDNMDNLIIKSGNRDLKGKARDEIWLLMFTTAINSQGFEIIDFQYEENGNAILILRDLTEQNSRDRGIHSSQLILPVWGYTEAKKIVIEYRLKNNRIFLRSSALGEICQLIESGEKSISYLAENVEFEIINHS